MRIVSLLRRLLVLSVLAAALLLGVENIEALSRPLRLRFAFPGTESFGVAEIPTVFFCLVFFLLGLTAARLGGCRARSEDLGAGRDAPRTPTDGRLRGPMP